MIDFKSWIAQRSTIHGIAVASLVITTVAAHFAGADNNTALVLGAIPYALAHMGINETPATQSAETLAKDVLTAYLSKSVSTALPGLLTDLQGFIGALVPPPAINPPATSTVATVQVAKPAVSTIPVSTVGEQPNA